MLTKILLGVCAATALALGVVFKLLLASYEAQGQLRSEVAEAEAIVERQIMAREAVEANRRQLIESMAIERQRSEAATAALINSQAALTTARQEFQLRLEAATAELSDEEMVCAMQPIPAALIDSLRQ